MNDYVEVRLDVEPCSETVTDLLAALLAECGFESFVPDSSGLTAYVPKALHTPGCVAACVGQLPMENLSVRISETDIEGRDWNAEWEKNYFKPIVIAGRCVIHSSFHNDIPAAEYDIVIDPKMAFGTGHHTTTSLIVSALLDMNLDGLDVIDMGTGTAILAILAAMRGARRVAGIEIDPFAAVNARENLALNGVEEKVAIIDGDASALESAGFKANLFLANINRNVITADMPRYAASLAPGATVLFSGFYEADVSIVAEAAGKAGLTIEGYTVGHEGWSCVRARRD